MSTHNSDTSRFRLDNMPAHGPNRSPERTHAREPRLAGSESTLAIVERLKDGDNWAADDLVTRSLPPLRRWAHGRLPRWARDLRETQDIVQECMVDTLKRVPVIDIREAGSLQRYLRRSVSNRIHSEMLRARRRPEQTPVEELDRRPGDSPDPLQLVMDSERKSQLNALLSTLAPEDRTLVEGREGLGLSFKELAVATGKPSADAARVATNRAKQRLWAATHGRSAS